MDIQRETLNKLAQELGITQLVLTSGSNTSHNSYLGGNAFEALFGAIYLDRGYDACMRFMDKRILTQYFNLDKVAYKEVNFKSKLIEWSQKNRVKVDFKLLEQDKDKGGSPKFTYQVVIEGLEAGVGSGYSKKESQQLAAKLTLEQLRKKPQFIDAVFAAKANRTKMEEMPVQTVPETEQSDDFIILHSQKEQTQTISTENSQTASQKVDETAGHAEEDDEFDLSDITTRPASREDIIAAAEEAAFKEDN